VEKFYSFCASLSSYFKWLFIFLHLFGFRLNFFGPFYLLLLLLWYGYAKVSNDRIHWIDYWIDRYLNQGEQLDRIFYLLNVWLNERRTIKALELVASATVHAGRRCDLNLLLVGVIEPAQQAEAIIADTHFAVKRRSLI
jgi:hypothetical protein